MIKANEWDVAVIGMAGRFPKAQSVGVFWENLRNGVDGVATFSEAELEDAGVAPAKLQHPDFVKRKGSLDSIEDFDASFFGYTPKEAMFMDPQLRLFHEVCHEAIEDAGYDSTSYGGRIGLYAGNSQNMAWMQHILPWVDPSDEFDVINLNDSNTFSTRIAYNLNLRGPAITVQSACSTSLVAIHLACQALISGECDMALAGGASVFLPKKNGYLYVDGMLLSKSGACRAFDASADGLVFGDGAGCVVLKMLDDAIRDRDHIYAVVKGSAVNNDGSAKAGFTAPSPIGQALAIRSAQLVAGIEPHTISLMEAHGAGSPLGDPIEFEGLKRAFGSVPNGTCALGSVKTSVGHLNQAAGVTGFIKAVLCLFYRELVPSLHFAEENPNINLADSPFYINQETKPWVSATGTPLRAGVSAFGIGGTNAHIVLQEPPVVDGPKTGRRSPSLVTLSAASTASLDNLKTLLVDYLQAHPDVDLEDVSYTLQTGRRRLAHRCFLVADDSQSAAQLLRSGESERMGVLSHFTVKDDRSVVFMFPGQGAQYINMGRELYDTERVFRDEVNLCLEILEELGCPGLHDLLYPTGGQTPSQDDIHTTDRAQALVFTVEYALAKQLIHWGIRPSALIGYSFGEYTAACLAGVFSLRDALKLVTTRGKLMATVPQGTVLSVPLSETELRPLIGPRMSIAADNAESCVVAGDHDAMAGLEVQLRERRIVFAKLELPASHSVLMDDILQPFQRVVQTVGLAAPRIPLISNVSGKQITNAEATSPVYWARHLRETVRFADGIRELGRRPSLAFLEVGPGMDLSALAQRFVDSSQRHIILNLMTDKRRSVCGRSLLLSRLGLVWANGVSVDWNAFHAKPARQRLSLPTYPFDRRRYWLDGLPPNHVTPSHHTERRSPQTIVGYVPRWEAAEAEDPAYVPAPDWRTSWLVFVDNTNGIGSQLAHRLQEIGDHVVVVTPAAKFTMVDECRFEVNPANAEDYELLLAHINVQGNEGPRKIVYAWNIDKGPVSDPLARARQSQSMGLLSVLHLAKAIMAATTRRAAFELIVLTDTIFSVHGYETVQAEKATILGALHVIPQEYAGMTCRAIEFEPQDPRSWQYLRLLDKLQRELRSPIRDQIVSYRHGTRYVRLFRPLRLEPPKGTPIQLRRQGVYLITGGLGSIGMLLAEHLLTRYSARVVLTGRSWFPCPEQWDQYLGEHNSDDPIAQKIVRLKDAMKVGGEVLVAQGDVADEALMQGIIEQLERQLGALNGVFHAAGVVGPRAFAPIEEITSHQVDEQLQAKLYGVLVLDKLLGGRSLDFCLLMSSLTTVLGGIGHVAYAAANIFLDHFVHAHNRAHTNRWMTVDWDFWEVGSSKGGRYYGRSAEEFALRPTDAIPLMECLLDGVEHSQVLITAGKFEERIHTWTHVGTSEEQSLVVAGGADIGDMRPLLSNDFVNARDELEARICSLWSDVLGFARIGIRDGFLELGGDSVKAVSMIARIFREFNVAVPISEFFTNDTVEGLAALLRKETNSPGTIQRLLPSDEDVTYPLSSAQKRLYVVSQLSGESVNYNTPFAMSLLGTLDCEKLEKAFEIVINRHDIFRTSFETSSGTPMQRVHDKVPFHMPVVQVDRTRIGQEVAKFVQPFDLTKAPLIRAKVLQVEPHENVLLFDIHHLCSDGVTVEILKRDLAMAYAAQELPRSDLQYHDFVKWERSALKDKTYESDRRYWLDRFDQVPDASFPTDFPRPDIQSFNGNRIEFGLGADTVRRLRVTARMEGATLYIALLSILSILIARYTMRDETVIGTPTAGRTHPDFEDIAGNFVNMLAMRTVVPKDSTFLEILRQTKKIALEAYGHQTYPFEELIAELPFKPQTDRNPLFQVVFAMQNMDEVNFRLDGVDILPFPISTRASIFDIYLQAVERDGDVRFLLDYKTRLFAATSIERLASRIVFVAEEVSRNPVLPVKEIAFKYDFIDSRSTLPPVDFKL